MIYVQFAEALDLTESPALEESFLERTASKVLEQICTGPEVDVALVLTEDAQLRQLNRDFLGIDSPTDVLAFPGGEIDPDSGSFYLGDVVISYPRARIQATEAGHSVMDELQLLVVHGLLHLLGYDHADEQSKVAMWGMQREILSGTISANRLDHSVEDDQSIS